jgi:peptidoglycan hydrolase-like protein with peptidoglycan-binding domain
MRRLLIICAALICSAAAGLGQGNDISTAQQKLKDAGFYYGEITGKSDTETSAAIRRYQIRNGLKVTGNLDAETRKSLGLRGGGSSTPAPRATPAPTPPPTPVPMPQMIEPEEGVDDLRDLRDTQPAAPRQLPDEYGEEAMEYDMGGLFDGTPYAAAPPHIQQQLIVSAQVQLARQGLYRSGVDGIFGPGTAAALRAFQSRAGLYVSGRLDVETLEALGLLPGQRRFRGPRYRTIRPPVIIGPGGERIYIPR